MDENTTTTTTNDETKTDAEQRADAEALANDQSDQNVTTTTSVNPDSDQASANYPGGEASPMAERQGEQAIDKGAQTNVLGGENPDDDQQQANNIAQAKADALANHAADQPKA